MNLSQSAMAENMNKISAYLSSIGCCKFCCLRFLKIRDDDQYLNDALSSDIISPNTVEALKKAKSNPCIVCLGLLQDDVIDEIIQNENLKEANDYDSATFSCSINMPTNLLLRQYLLNLDLKKKFVDFYNDDKPETQLNKIWKVVIKDKLAKKLNKTFDNSLYCNFSINIAVKYEDENLELERLQNAAPDHFMDRSKKMKKYSFEMFTKKDILSLLTEIDESKLADHCSVPPDIPSKMLKFKSIEFKHASIYFAGRYCKFSRKLSQSPWIIDGVKTMETSVQELIFDGIHGVLPIPYGSLKFSASGREDCDVRCLGRGRPFYVEISNPKITDFTFEQFRKVEKEINRTRLIKIRDLQFTKRDELKHIKSGEEKKTKDYMAICISEKPFTGKELNILNRAAPLEIHQKTPIRVLHRRPLAVREKLIYEMRASILPEKNNLFQLEVSTQAGTYVKEFVHGDFGRTTPNIGTLIGFGVDILALDVMAINLDWPKPIEYDDEN